MFHIFAHAVAESVYRARLWYIISPVFYLAALHICNVSFQDNHRMVLLEVAMPPLISAVAVIARAGLDSRLAISCILLGVFIVAFSSPLWL